MREKLDRERRKGKPRHSGPVIFGVSDTAATVANVDRPRQHPLICPH